MFTNILLADELNRAGPRTQSALLEAMGEQQVSIDGTVHRLPRPFLVMATQNLAESHGTFPLPNSQMDRFSVSMRLGFPNRAQEMDILDRSEQGMPEVGAALSSEEVVEMQETRRHPAISLGASPRGGTFLQRTSQAWAAFSGRSFAIPEDVQEVSAHVLSHRVIMHAGAQITEAEAITEVLASVPVPV